MFQENKQDGNHSPKLLNDISLFKDQVNGQVESLSASMKRIQEQKLKLRNCDKNKDKPDSGIKTVTEKDENPEHSNPKEQRKTPNRNSKRNNRALSKVEVES